MQSQEKKGFKKILVLNGHGGDTASIHSAFSEVRGRHPQVFNDVKVRQALAMAVNVPAIVENILEGAAVPAKGYLAPSVFGFKDMELGKRYPYNPQKAKALLAEAGWKPGPDGIPGQRQPKAQHHVPLHPVPARGLELQRLHEIVSAARSGSWIDHASRLIALLGLCMPVCRACWICLRAVPSRIAAAAPSTAAARASRPMFDQNAGHLARCWLHAR